MPFFNFRRGDPSSKSKVGPGAQPESVELVRKRAKHRLIGAAVLVLIGVLGFPLLFDTQPRPIAVDIPIEIPAKNAVKPLTLPAKAPAAVASAASSAAVEPVPAAVATTNDKPELATTPVVPPKEEVVEQKAAVAPVVPAQPAPKKEAKPEPKPEPKAEVKAKVPASEDAARAKALLEGQPTAVASSEDESGRTVVQVGAFADATKAREARAKLEKAGLKTYTQVAETKDGKRIRVRVGPFASKAEAEKAAAKIRALDLPTAILSL